MARHETVSCDSSTWTQLTNADATSATFQVLDNECWIAATADANAPTSLSGAMLYQPGHGEMNVAFSDFAPGISGARLWAQAVRAARVVVSHG